MITIEFKAKRVWGTSFNCDGYGYKVPALRHNHVSSSDRGMRDTLFIQGLNDARLTKARLTKACGYWPTFVFEDHPDYQDFTITPIGNGYMANVSITLKV